MPTRLVREGFLDSDPILAAGELAEILFTRLLLVADDYGRFDGRVTVICRRCWPLGGPSEESVTERLDALAREELIVRYEVDGKPFIYIPKFRQRNRTPHPKFPAPPGWVDGDDGHVTVKRHPNDTSSRTKADADSDVHSDTDAKKSALAPFEISPEVRKWATNQGFAAFLDQHLAYFRDFLASSGKSYKDRDAAFRNCIRSDWGDVRKTAQRKGGDRPKPWRSGAEPDEVLTRAAAALQIDPWERDDGETHGQFRARIVDAGGESMLRPGAA